MKKLLKYLTAVLAALVLAFSLSGCAGAAVGAYKVSSIKISVGSLTTEYAVGEDCFGFSLTEEDCVLALNGDKTWSMTMEIPGVSVANGGEWSIDGKNITFFSGSEESVATAVLDGKKLTFTQVIEFSSYVIVLIKQ